jgi:sirohydrochlorin cobaltochelatase
MKKAILVTSFGTSHKDTREKCLDVIENEVREKYGNEKVERAYTSGVIRRIVEKKEGIHIYDQKEGLEALKNKGYDEIITMSLHILGGIEYSKLSNEYGKVTQPLLTTDEDYRKIVNNEKFNDLEGNDAIIFMGHGSESAADVTYQRLQEEYIKAGKNNIFIATVEGKVTIEDVIEKLKKTDYKKILLKPFMIVAGDHAKNDMASDEEDSWKTVLQNEGYEVNPVLKGMGEYKFIRDMFMEKLEAVYGKDEKKNEKIGSKGNFISWFKNLFKKR